MSEDEGYPREEEVHISENIPEDDGPEEIPADQEAMDPKLQAQHSRVCYLIS
jgi:hypothetical protein